MRKKKSTVKLTIGFRKYVDVVTHKYLARRKALANTYLEVEYNTHSLFDENYNRENNEMQYFPLKQRFTKAYGNSIYQKLKVLTGRNVYSFWTLTSRVDGSMMGFRDQHLLIKRGWRDFRSLMAKVGLKRVDYLRCYELTDKFGLHIHIAFYSVLSKLQIRKLAEYWDKHRGWVKIYHYHNHIRSWPKSSMKDAFEPYRKDQTDYGQVHAIRRESWVINNKLEFGHPREVRIDGKVSKYVWKYMVKLASEEKQALLWDNRIRTYSVSQNLNKSIQNAREAWKEENYVERGYVIGVGVYKSLWLEQEEWKKIFVQKIYKDHVNRIDFNTIELELSLHGFGQNKIVLEARFNASLVALSINDWDGYTRLRGFTRAGFGRFDNYRFFHQSDEAIARDILLRYFADRFRCSIFIS